jgi:hypothetical protein
MLRVEVYDGPKLVAVEIATKTLSSNPDLEIYKADDGCLMTINRGDSILYLIEKMAHHLVRRGII